METAGWRCRPALSRRRGRKTEKLERRKSEKLERSKSKKFERRKYENFIPEGWRKEEQKIEQDKQPIFCIFEK